MSEKTGIAWTDHTFNPWWGCVRVSPGCENCYAERDSKRYGFKLWGPTTDRRFFTDKHWNEPRKWDRDAIKDLGRPARVFCASMADVFEDRRDLDEPRARLFALIEETPNLHWQLLTKRPENAVRLVPRSWRDAWPDNAWALTTGEDNARLAERVIHLLNIPALIRGLSIEPLLEDVSGELDMALFPEDDDGRPMQSGIHWVIFGGESGGRATDLQWIRRGVERCRAAGVATFVKQYGSMVYDGDQGEPTGRLRTSPETGRRQLQMKVDRLTFRHRHAADPSEWPAGDWPREFPA